MAPTVYTPPVNTYIPIGSVTLSATATEVVFSSLPTSGYRDLVLVVTGYTTTTATNGQWLRAEYNGDTTTANYNRVTMEAGGGSTSIRSLSGSERDIGKMNTNSSGNTAHSTSVINFQDYSASDKHKTIISRSSGKDGALDFAVSAIATRWANTAPISSIKLFLDSNSFAIGSTFSLYAIAG